MTPIERAARDVIDARFSDGDKLFLAMNALHFAVCDDDKLRYRKRLKREYRKTHPYHADDLGDTASRGIIAFIDGYRDKKDVKPRASLNIRENLKRSR